MPQQIDPSIVSYEDETTLTRKGAEQRRQRLLDWVPEYINNPDNAEAVGTQFDGATAIQITNVPHYSSRPDDHMNVAVTINGQVTHTHFPMPPGYHNLPGKTKADIKRQKNEKRRDQQKKDRRGGGGGAAAATKTVK